ncbi:MAG: endonuclease III [Bacillota bacterium]|uniref:Endonuclease III n=1 Tax=Thermanaerosceptrum fracticalcis TaxID=1712410 RepID=A0A7G6E6A9_THEFR|nr:endonuclease III [Thermanaerosceptrum fracticalcis]QNB47613.1 endonuclease III [Thermanaerosceptrum fracticalcis]
MPETDKHRILEILESCYQGSTTALEFANSFQLLIATILSAQTTDNQVNKLTRKLFAQYPDAKALVQLSEEELADEIKGVGLYKNKARNILATAKILLEKYDGQVPRDREALMELPGVGRKTANVVLANAFGIPAIGVDTHVFRVANRLNLAQGRTPEQVEQQLMRAIPREKWGDAHHWLIWHGRKICKAQNPQCSRCPVNQLCPSKTEEKKEKRSGRQGG